MGLWTLLEGLLLLTNALAILNEDRFLAPKGWSFSDFPGGRAKSFKGQLVGLIYATQGRGSIHNRSPCKIRGNKWTAIAKLIPGRTDNAIKNYWNFTLRRPSTEVPRSQPIPSGIVYPVFQTHTTSLVRKGSLDGNKASSVETLSNGNANPGQHQSAGAMSLTNTTPELHAEDRSRMNEDHLHCVPEEHPSIPRPVARIIAFSAYKSIANPSSCSPFSSSGLMREPMLSPTKMDIWGCKSSPKAFTVILWFLRGVDLAAVRLQTLVTSHNSLVGPEFVDYLENPSFSSHELISIATDLNGIAWIKSGVEYGTATTTKTAAANESGPTVSPFMAAQMGVMAYPMNPSYRQFMEGSSALAGLMQHAVAAQGFRQASSS